MALGQVVSMKLGRIDKKAFLKYLEEQIKSLDKEKERMRSDHYEVVRKTFRHILKKIRKAAPNEEFTLDSQEHKALEESLKFTVETSLKMSADFWFFKRWMVRLMIKNYQHLLSVLQRRRS